MTSRERINAAFNHQEPDRTPMFEYVLLSPVADKILGRKYAGDPDNWQEILNTYGWEKAVLQNAIDRLELAEILGHDMLYVTNNPLPLPPVDKGKTPAPQKSDEIDDPVEKIRKTNKIRKENVSAIPDESMLIYIYLKEEMEKRGLDLPILAPAYTHGIWTNVDLMQTMLLEPEVAHEHFKLCTRDSQVRIAKYIEYGIEIMGIGGDFAGNRPLISPESYRKFIAPELQALSDQSHEAGCWTVNASDGNLWEVLDDFLITSRVDGYLEIDLHAGMDLKKLKDQYGEKITFLGNLDCGNTLSFGTTEEIRRHVITCLESGAGNGGHILTASNAITSSVPLENYLTVVNTYRDFWNLPMLKI